MSTKRARQLRHDMPFAERLVWSRLRNFQQEGWKFRRQHPVGPYYADFACVEIMLIIEIDGDTHSSPEEIERDRKRTIFLESEGWRIVRFWNVDVLENLEGVADTILNTIRYLDEARKAPLPHAGEEGPALRSSVGGEGL